MSYDVKNMLRAKGLAKLPIFGEDEIGTEIFDFNSIIPMPEALEVEAGGNAEAAIEAAMTKLTMSSKRANIQSPELNNLEKEGIKYLTNIILYGYPTWYEWRIAKWGTKHNSYDLKIVDEDTVLFTTAINEPKPIVRELARKYPMLTIEHWWSGEEPGHYTGYREYNAENNGCEQFPDESQEAFDIFNKLWSGNRCVTKECGCWKRKCCGECREC